MLELVRPESEWERTEGVLEDILRWEDDGGQMSAIQSSARPWLSKPTAFMPLIAENGEQARM